MICSQRQEIRKKFGMPDHACEYVKWYFFSFIFLKILGTSGSPSAAPSACLSRTSAKFDLLLASLISDRAEDIEENRSIYVYIEQFLFNKIIGIKLVFFFDKIISSLDCFFHKNFWCKFENLLLD